jgi:hypothetical protein
MKNRFLYFIITLSWLVILDFFCFTFTDQDLMKLNEMFIIDCGLAWACEENE